MEDTEQETTYIDERTAGEIRRRTCAKALENTKDAECTPSDEAVLGRIAAEYATRHPKEAAERGVTAPEGRRPACWERREAILNAVADDELLPFEDVNAIAVMGMRRTVLPHVVFDIEDGGSVEGYWSDLRLDRLNMPAGWHLYSVRGGDDGWEPATIEHGVLVNHTADILTREDLDRRLDANDGWLPIKDWGFDGQPDLSMTAGILHPNYIRDMAESARPFKPSDRPERERPGRDARKPGHAR